MNLKLKLNDVNITVELVILENEYDKYGMLLPIKLALVFGQAQNDVKVDNPETTDEQQATSSTQTTVHTLYKRLPQTETSPIERNLILLLAQEKILFDEISGVSFHTAELTSSPPLSIKNAHGNNTPARPTTPKPMIPPNYFSGKPYLSTNKNSRCVVLTDSDKNDFYNDKQILGTALAKLYKNAGTPEKDQKEFSDQYGIAFTTNKQRRDEQKVPQTPAAKQNAQQKAKDNSEVKYEDFIKLMDDLTHEINSVICFNRDRKILKLAFLAQVKRYVTEDPAYRMSFKNAIAATLTHGINANEVKNFSEFRFLDLGNRAAEVVTKYDIKDVFKGMLSQRTTTLLLKLAEVQSVNELQNYTPTQEPRKKPPVPVVKTSPVDKKSNKL